MITHPVMDHSLPANHVRQVPGAGDPEERDYGRDDDGEQQEFTRLPEHAGAIREDEGAKDIAWRLLWHPQQGGKQNLSRLTTQDFEDRCAFDALFLEDLSEHGVSKNPKPDPQTDGDHYDADEEGDAPSPDHELVSRQPTENKDRRVRQKEPGRGAKLWPGGDEARDVCWSVPIPSRAAPQPPHSPPTPMPWTRRMNVSRTAPQMPMLA